MLVWKMPVSTKGIGTLKFLAISPIAAMIEHFQKNDYLRFLNRNYCIASHLTERLDELEGSVFKAGLKQVLRATLALLITQLRKTDDLYEAVGSTGSLADTEPVTAWLESLFSEVQGRDGHVSFIALLDYLSVADSLMAESAKLAQLVCAQTPALIDNQFYNPEILRPVISFLESREVGV